MSHEERQIAADVFCALVGDSTWNTYVEVTEIRSAPDTDIVDVRHGDQWYRISVAPIAEPISEREHTQDLSDTPPPKPPEET